MQSLDAQAAISAWNVGCSQYFTAWINCWAVADTFSCMWGRSPWSSSTAQADLNYLAGIAWLMGKEVETDKESFQTCAKRVENRLANPCWRLLLVLRKHSCLYVQINFSWFKMVWWPIKRFLITNVLRRTIRLVKSRPLRKNFYWFTKKEKK